MINAHHIYEKPSAPKTQLRDIVPTTKRESLSCVDSRSFRAAASSSSILSELLSVDSLPQEASFCFEMFCISFLVYPIQALRALEFMYLFCKLAPFLASRINNLPGTCRFLSRKQTVSKTK